MQWVALAVVTGVALSIGVARDDGAHTEAERVDAIASEVRCPTCRGLSAAESDAKAAAAIRAEIRDRLRAGQSPDLIRAYLVSRYGEQALLRPSGRGLTALVWALPATVLVVAIAGLTYALWRWRARGTAGSLSDADRALVDEASMTQQEGGELAAERDFLLRSIRDLDAERAAGELDEAHHTALREQYTTRAAAVLRALEGGEPVTPDSAPNRSVRWRLAVGAVAVAVLAGLAGLAISSSAGERLPGEQVTGSITEGANSKIAKAQQLVSDGEVLEAIQLYDEVLADDSQHPVALAQRGWLVSRAGLLDEGLTYVDRAIASEPAYAEARFFRSMILREQGDRDGAAQELRALLALEPPAQLAELAETLLAELEAGASP